MAREDQSNTLLVGRLDDLFIPNGAARLYHRRHPGIGQHIEPVAEGKERVAGCHGTFRLVPCLLHSVT